MVAERLLIDKQYWPDPLGWPLYQSNGNEIIFPVFVQYQSVADFTVKVIASIQSQTFDIFFKTLLLSTMLRNERASSRVSKDTISKSKALQMAFAWAQGALEYLDKKYDFDSVNWS